MKKSIILGMSVFGIIFNSIQSFADNDQYPATNFQPKVIYIDKDLVKSTPQKAEFDPKYPATNFQPKVIYIDKSAATTSSSTPRKKAEFDPKYPAANFEPKVIFPAG